MALLETLPNQETQKRLDRLAAELDRLAAGDALARATVPALRSRHYPTSLAVLEVLSESGTAMRPCEVQAAVEVLLGRSVPRATIKSFLLYGSRGEKARLERLGQGRYRLRT
jgi:hypothetical protein